MGWWYVYIVKCGDATLYTGATNDVLARVATHNLGKGARYTRARLPVTVVWKRRVSGKSAALSLEYRVKQLTRSEKERLITGDAASRRKIRPSIASRCE